MKRHHSHLIAFIYEPFKEIPSFFLCIFLTKTHFFVSDLGYLNENGHLNLKNFEKYMEKLSEVRHIVVIVAKKKKLNGGKNIYMLRKQ